MSFDLAIQNPGICRASVEQSPDFLRRVVANVYVGHIRKIHMIVQMETQTPAALLSVLVQLALVLAVVGH